MENRDFEPNFPLKLIRKDLQLVSETAYENEIPMPSANIAKEWFSMAVKEGFGDEDFSALFKLMND